MVYVLNNMYWDVDCPEDTPTCSIELFHSEKDAYLHACAYIQEWIHSEWNLQNPNTLANAKAIQDAIVTGNGASNLHHYKIAISKFESLQHYTTPDFLRQITIEKRDILAQPNYPVIRQLTPASVTNVSPPVEAKAFVPTKQGAKCRLRCGQEFEYAYADKADGTFECRGCKMMHQVFST